MRALFSGVTGIRSHQVRMDVIGNNIANVNTTGFKGSRVTFQDVFSQTMSSGSASTNPQQVGLGAAVAGTDLSMAQGSFQLTGREMDLAIEGSGMFIMRDANGLPSYTRAGNFDWDSNGFLVNPATGSRVQGWMTNTAGQLPNASSTAVGDIRIPRGDVTRAQMTANAEMSGNLDAGTAVAGTYSTPVVAYDSLGTPRSVVVQFTKTGANAWSWTAQGPAGITTSGSGTLAFNTDGTLQAATGTTISISGTGIQSQTVTLDFQRVTQSVVGSGGDVPVRGKADGYPMGTLETLSLDASGIVNGVYSNGARRTLAQVGMANFTNPAGLLKSGSASFASSIASGDPIIGTAGTGGRGRLVPGNLEMSNVDLSTEFTNMIMTQRGFQANTKVISAADELLQDLVNLRR